MTPEHEEGPVGEGTGGSVPRPTPDIPAPALRVLCVDDEPGVLNLLRQILGPTCHVRTAESGPCGLELLGREGPFAVVMSDMHMPEMSGITFLQHVRERSPESVRILLTGATDLNVAMAGINEGQIFRFLTKPMGFGEVQRAVEAAAEQHRLVTAERVLLEQTLHGSITMLVEVLATVNPVAFGRAIRVRRKLLELCRQMSRVRTWEADMAAMLSQVGCMILPPQPASRLYRGEALSPVDQRMVDELPEASVRLLDGIPRMEHVQQLILLQNRRYDGNDSPEDGIFGDRIPWAARAIKVLFDMDILEAAGVPPDKALFRLRSRTGRYDPAILHELSRSSLVPEAEAHVEAIDVGRLSPGMTFAEDVLTPQGVIVVSHGQEATENLVLRIRNFALRGGIVEPLHVRLAVARPAA